MPKPTKPWVCDECGKRYTEKLAIRAMENGCPAGCSGLDVHEIADDPCPMHPAYSYHDCPESHATRAIA